MQEATFLQDSCTKWLRRTGGPVWCGSDGGATQAAALPLGQPAPDAEALVVRQRVLQALGPHLAAGADALGLAGGAALLREERLRVGLGAERPFLPVRLLGVTGSAEQAAQRRLLEDDRSGRHRVHPRRSGIPPAVVDQRQRVCDHVHSPTSPHPANGCRPANDSAVSTALSVGLASRSCHPGDAVHPVGRPFSTMVTCAPCPDRVSPWFLVLAGGHRRGRRARRARHGRPGEQRPLVPAHGGRAAARVGRLGGVAVPARVRARVRGLPRRRPVGARQGLPDPGHPPLHRRRAVVRAAGDLPAARRHPAARRRGVDQPRGDPVARRCAAWSRWPGPPSNLVLGACC